MKSQRNIKINNNLDVERAYRLLRDDLEQLIEQLTANGTLINNVQTGLTTTQAGLTDVDNRLERIENPYPETITVTFAGITNCPYGDEDLTSDGAIAVNGTWELTETSAGSKVYELDNATVYIQIGLGGAGGVLAYCHSGYYSEGTYNSFYKGIDSYERGDTINNANVISYCEPTEPNVKGYGGTLFIH